MNKECNVILNQDEKERYISVLTDDLLLLRTKANLTQEQLSNLTGISRQTYYAIETKKRRMSWNTYLSLMFVFMSMDETRDLAKKLDAIPDSFVEKLNGKLGETTL